MTAAKNNGAKAGRHGDSFAIGGPVVDAGDFSRILVAAERYACGRATYVVGSTAAAIVRYKSFLSEEQLDGIVEDVEGREAKDASDRESGKEPACGISRLGMDFDRDVWLRLVANIKGGEPFYTGFYEVKQSDSVSTDDLYLLIVSAFRYDIRHDAPGFSGIGLDTDGYARFVSGIYDAAPDVRENWSHILGRDLASELHMRYSISGGGDACAEARSASLGGAYERLLSTVCSRESFDRELAMYGY